MHPIRSLGPGRALDCVSFVAPALPGVRSRTSSDHRPSPLHRARAFLPARYTRRCPLYRMGVGKTGNPAGAGREVPFHPRPATVPLVLGFISVAAAAFATFNGEVMTAIGWLIATAVLERVSRRSVPLPKDVVDFAPPRSILGQNSAVPFVVDGRRVEPSTLSSAIEETMLKQLTAGTQIGMSVSVHYKGRHVAHVCGGVFRSMGGDWDTWSAVDSDTLFMSYSVAKGVAGAALMTCVDENECAYTDRVTQAWPEFGDCAGKRTGEQGRTVEDQGKQELTIAEAVSHRGGMCGVAASFLPVVAAHVLRDPEEAWRAGTRFIENYRPEWTSGTEAKYHYVSFSWIIGGIIERVSGLSIYDVVQERVGGRLGGARGEDDRGNMFMGMLPPAYLPRAAALEAPYAYPTIPTGSGGVKDAGSGKQGGGEGLWERGKRFVFGWMESSIFVAAGNSRPWRKVCLPSSNGFFTAAALSRMYGALAHGGTLLLDDGEVRRLVSEETVREVQRNWRDTVGTRGGASRASKPERARLACGFSPWVDQRISSDDDNLCTLSHFGMGSCIAFGEVETGIAIAVLKNAYEPVAVVGGSLSPDVEDIVRVVRANL